MLTVILMMAIIIVCNHTTKKVLMVSSILTFLLVISSLRKVGDKLVFQLTRIPFAEKAFRLILLCFILGTFSSNALVFLDDFVGLIRVISLALLVLGSLLTICKRMVMKVILAATVTILAIHVSSSLRNRTMTLLSVMVDKARRTYTDWGVWKVVYASRL